MSKDTSSPELLGTIKFVFDKTKSRTLNATQAYDASTSQIVLASYPATSTIKGPTKGPGKLVIDADYLGAVGVTATQTGQSGLTPREAGKAGLAVDASAPKRINLVWSQTPTLAAKQSQFLVLPNTLQFSATLVQPPYQLVDLNGGAKSNAAKEIFYGNIIVGTGLYRTWQNKYAVLKVDLLTNKAILRIYNE